MKLFSLFLVLFLGSAAVAQEPYLVPADAENIANRLKTSLSKKNSTAVDGAARSLAQTEMSTDSILRYQLAAVDTQKVDLTGRKALALIALVYASQTDISRMKQLNLDLRQEERQQQQAETTKKARPKKDSMSVIDAKRAEMEQSTSWTSLGGTTAEKLQSLIEKRLRVNAQLSALAAELLPRLNSLAKSLK